jgi:hypothetical protein
VIDADLGIASTAEEEFDRQLQTLLDRKYPALAGVAEGEFDARVESLRPAAREADWSPGARIPFVVVVTSRVVPTVAAVETFEVAGRSGFTDMQDEIDDYRPIEGLVVPDAPMYLLLDVDTGADTLNVRPNDALPLITRQGRTPLTVDEGVAVVTHFPDVFKVRNAFQALGSRAANKRVPSFWVSKGAPRLGWCWAGNPHTWLGAASAGGRIA